jgi:hypothetical protein
LNREFNLEPIQPFYPLSFDGQLEPVGQDQAIYGVDKVFPYDQYRNLSTHFMSGHSIGFLSFSPIDYNPVTGQVTLFHHVTVVIETETSSRANDAQRLLKQDSYTRDRIINLVDNDRAVFAQTREAVPAGYDYLIVLDQDKIAQWQPLISYYESKAWRVEYKTVQEITASAAGNDLQAKIRNTITTEYEDNNIRSVLLAGDTDVIPHRGFYVNMNDASYTDNDIPADIYYGALDGTWNTDNDTHWGEPMETDLIYEVAVGRICYNNNTEIENAINKIVSYQAIPVEDEIESCLMVGEYLWDAPTYGGDYMDEMIGGSSATGYTTVGVPTSWDIDTIYDRDLGGDGSWGSNTMLNALSLGYNTVNHLGHSNTTYTMRLSNNQITTGSITNNGSNHNFSTIYTQGCYGGAFDNRDTNPGSYTSDCITEKFQALATGVVAMVSNSRYGWGSNGSTNGPSQYYHRQFIDAMFGEGINEIGWANADSKADVIPFVNEGSMYWCYYEVNLFGDPGMRMWTATPQYANIQLLNTIYGGSQIATFNVGVAHADVRIKNGTETIFIGESDESGDVYAIFDQAVFPGQYQLILNANNFYPTYFNFDVIPSNEPYITCTEATFHDDDNIFQLGDHIFIDLFLENIGTTSSNSSGSVSLSSDSDVINVLNPMINIANLPDNQELQIDDAFEIILQGSFNDHAIIPLQFTASFGGNITNYTANITLNAPYISLTDMQIVSENYFVSPGDDLEVYFEFENTGSAPASNIMLIIFDSSPYLTMNSTDVTIDEIVVDGTGVNTVPLTIHVNEDCPMDTQLDLHYFAGGNGTNSIQDVLSIYVNSGVFTFEPSTHNFIDYVLTPEYQDQWHRETQRNHTDNGGYSMKFGGAGTTDYSNSCHGALETISLDIIAGSELKFWHWIDAEDDTNNIAWDGGLVQMSVDEGPWTEIIPEDNYPFMIMSNPDSPFEAGTGVFSGSHGWQQETFPLGSTSGNVKFRFVFGSDAYVTGEGWYIDDVSIFNRVLGTDEQVDLVTSANLLKGNYPNPFNPETTIAFQLKSSVKNAKIEIYNIRGQKQTTLKLDEATRAAGQVVWKADTMSSGVYFYRLVADGKTIETRKAILMK